MSGCNSLISFLISPTAEKIMKWADISAKVFDGEAADAGLLEQFG